MKNIYFIGINGIGMSGLAKIMADKGYKVFGADLKRNKITEELESLGVTVYPTHEANNVRGMDLVIRSSAIKECNPEYSYARENKIKVIKRGELLAFLMNKQDGVAVAGTHGKTTTSSMLSACCLGIDPTIVVGGILPEIKSNAKPGTNPIFIAEADESDNSFLFLHPKYAIIMNVEEDHMENHGSYENIERSFHQFLNQTSDEAVLNFDCENLREIAKKHKNIKFYSTKSKDCFIYADNIRVEDGASKYDVFIDNKFVGEFALGIPGEHNISNSLGVIYYAIKFGISVETIKNQLLNFRGARRRFDVLYDGACQIIDDYAHHPTEIKVTIAAAKERAKDGIVAIFQPHRFSRVKFLFEQFNNVFEGAEQVLLLPTYSAGETDNYGMTPEVIAKQIAPNGNIKLVNKEEEILEYINKDSNKMYLFMGAGDISLMAHNISRNMAK